MEGDCAVVLIAAVLTAAVLKAAMVRAVVVRVAMVRATVVRDIVLRAVLLGATMMGGSMLTSFCRMAFVGVIGGYVRAMRLCSSGTRYIGTVEMHCRDTFGLCVGSCGYGSIIG